MKNLRVFGKQVNVNDKVEINLECEIKMTVNIRNYYTQEINTYHGVNRITLNKIKGYIVIESKQHHTTVGFPDKVKNEIEICMENESAPEFHYFTNLYPF